MMTFATRTLTMAAAALSIAATPAAAPMEWNVDNAHTKVGFSVRHFFTPVEGSFDAFEAQLIWDRETPANSTVNATIQVASVDTENTDRDAHLLSGDFFDAERFPQITFRSTAVEARGDDMLMVTGDLTIRDVTKQVQMPVRILGVQAVPAEMQQMLGGAVEIASFEGELEIDRRDFGVGSGNFAETAIVGGPVTITIQLEANHG